MEEWGYFQRALKDFTREAASGGAIRHLADLGYTVKQIAEQLDFPTPYEEVRRAVWEHYLKKGIILPEEPGSGRPREKAVYVREYDQFGKASFRRVTETEGGEAGAVERWKETSVDYGEGSAEELSALLRGKIGENGEAASYVSCDFGLMAETSPRRYQAALSSMGERQRQYVLGLPWERRRVYHRLDGRMTEILLCLCGAGEYEGECFFLRTREKVSLCGGNPFDKDAQSGGMSYGA